MSRVNFFEHHEPGAAEPPPEPTLDHCCECGDFGCYGDGVEFYCSKHAPPHLKRPADFTPEGEPNRFYQGGEEGDDDYGI